MENKALISYLGENSYFGILNNIKNDFRNSNPSSQVGLELVQSTYKKLNESKTPILQIKEFTSGGQQYAADDLTISDLIGKIGKYLKAGDNNFLINLAKEEHFANMMRTGNPDPEKSIDAIKSYFEEPASVIESAIKKGIFDAMKSNILNDMKGLLNIKKTDIQDKPKDLNEACKNIVESIRKFDTDNQQLNQDLQDYYGKIQDTNIPNIPNLIQSMVNQFNQDYADNNNVSELCDYCTNQLNLVESDIASIEDSELNESSVYIGDDLVKYNPIGLKLEDVKNNRVVMLTESTVIFYDNDTLGFKTLNESEIAEIVIPNSYKRMMTAINELKYDPKELTFSLNESWGDFSLSINDGKTYFESNNKKVEIELNDIQPLLLESINELNLNESQRITYLRDADNFSILAKNYDKLIKFDNLTAVRNINESNNTYVLFEDSDKYCGTPRILSSNEGTKLFESFGELLESSSNILKTNTKIDSLFNYALKNENKLFENRNLKINELKLEQKEIDSNIQKVNKLFESVEEGSIVYERLTNQKKQLDNKLNENMNQLNDLVNNFKLY